MAALFSMILRLADSFAWEVPSWERMLGRAPAMLEGGYSMRAVHARSGPR